jgi:acyl-CoA thioester hydrolase
MSKTGFPFEVSIEVVFRDIDAMGHVNNAVFFSYMETARIKYVAMVFEQSNLLDLELPLILVEATCSYKTPAYLGEQLTIGVGISRFGTKSFDLIYRVVGENGRLVASGKTIQVMYDYGSRRAFAIAEEIKARVQAFQGDWQPPAEKM